LSGDLAYGSPLRITEVKAAGDAWEVSGYASTFGNVDLGGDVIHRGAFADTLAAGKVRFLYAHDPGQVLGTVQELKEDERGLFGRFKISRTSLGQDVHTLLRDGALDSFSIGYFPKDFEFDDDGVRHLKAIELLETSVVAIPMNPKAVVTGVKSADYPAMGLTDILTTYRAHQRAAVAAAKAVAERRLADGRRLSDRVLEHLEELRDGLLADADALLALTTAVPAAKARETEPPAPALPTPATGETVAAAPEPTTPPEGTAPAEAAAPPADPATVKAAGLVDAHLRRARLRDLARIYGLPPLAPEAAG
jgi:HK97 family phage prohead protease